MTWQSMSVSKCKTYGNYGAYSQVRELRKRSDLLKKFLNVVLCAEIEKLDSTDIAEGRRRDELLVEVEVLMERCSWSAEPKQLLRELDERSRGADKPEVKQMSKMTIVPPFMTPLQQFRELRLADCTWDELRQLKRKQLYAFVREHPDLSCRSGRKLCDLWRMGRTKVGACLCCYHHAHLYPTSFLCIVSVCSFEKHSRRLPIRRPSQSGVVGPRESDNGKKFLVGQRRG
jgi:hypothetical protein